MTALLPDQPARDAIASDTAVSLFVEAGAGSGKTESLAKRMVATLKTDVGIHQMAAITFTRKAAGELRGRFQNELEKSFREEKDPEVKAKLGQALSRLETFFSGTVHAFCARILRERPVEAGVPPGFRELEAEEDRLLRQESLAASLDRLHAAGHLGLARLGEAGVSPGDLSDAFETLCEYDEVAFPSAEALLPDFSLARRAVLAFWEAWSPKLPVEVDRDATCRLLQHAEELRTDLPSLREGDAPALARILVSFERERKPVFKWWGKRPKEEILALAEEYRAFAEGAAADYLRIWRAYLYALAIPLLLEARKEARERRRREGLLNYQDLLRLAAEALRERSEIRRFFARRYRRLFVDEFQDTDPLQAEVMAYLAAEGGQDAELDWTRLKLRPGALFVVGDPKQSIYRFRRADLTTFRRMRALVLASGGRRLELTANFRSGHAILDWLDKAFDGPFPKEETRFQPCHLPLKPAGDGLSVPGGIAKISSGGKIPQCHLSDAEAIARFIRGAVEGGRLMNLHGRRGAPPRPARWSDFLILTAKRNHLSQYAQALESEGIPFEAGGAKAFADAPEARLLCDLASCLADPDDAPRAVGVLRGGLFGLDDPVLYRHRSHSGSFRFAGGPETQGDPEVLKALERLAHLHAETRRLPPAAVLESLLEETGLLALAAAGEGAGLAAGAILGVLERIRRAAHEGAPFAEVARLLEQEMDSPDAESSPLEPGRTDVVRLMNLHKAKGLEAPVVFLADPTLGQKPKVSVQVLREGGMPIGFLSLKASYGDHAEWVLAQPADWAKRENDEAIFLQAEQVRLRYVAATRARELLVVSRYDGKPTEAGTFSWPWLVFEPFLKDAPELDIPEAKPLPKAPEVDLSEQARSAAAETRIARLAKALQPSFAAMAPTSLEGEKKATRKPKVLAEGPGGAGWGTLIHGLLEACLRGSAPGSLGEVARVLATRISEETEEDLKPWLSQAVETARKVVTSRMWQEATDSPECHAEAPFAAEFTREELGLVEGPERVILSGRIDLAYQTPEGWVLVDYKTERLEEDLAAQAQGHKDQLRIYAEAWRRGSGQKVAKAGIFFTRRGDPVEWI